MIKAVIFDIYGTLLKKEIAGDLADTTERKDVMISSFDKLKKKYRINASSEMLFELFIGAIEKVHKQKKARGIKSPEVRIEKIWAKVLDAAGYDFSDAKNNYHKNNIDEFILKIARDHENFVERSLYPNTVLMLSELKKKGIVTGIISNAQFYTLLDMEDLLKKEKSKYSLYELFSKKLCFYSYEQGYSKPNPGSFIKLKKQLAKINIKPNETLYVGNDILNDVYAAKKAGLKTCLTINHETKYRDIKINPDYKIKNLKQIITILDSQHEMLFDKMHSRYSKKIFNNYILPVIYRIQSWHNPGKTVIIGIQGGQGTGKTTFAEFIKMYIEEIGYSVACFSIDDFYKSNIERIKMREKYSDNPYYQISRGVPGTHRIDELYNVLNSIKKGKSLDIPIFDKSLHNGQGDLSNKSYKINKKLDFVLFEGYCVGMPFVSEAELYKICNKRNLNIKRFDPDLKSTRLVCSQIKNYQKLWKQIDKFIMLREDSLNLQVKWRTQQENELKNNKGNGLSNKQIIYFVEKLMPFCCICYEKIKPDILIKINNKHDFYDVRLN